MIGYIKGKILSKKDGFILLENNGIGYEINCSTSLFNGLEINREGEAYTYLAVREDGLYLYGFSSLEEKQMFLKLITVSGVGPKMGIAVLSGMNLNDLAIKIATSDVKGLSAIKGLGKKTAERIILELREKVSAEGKSEEIPKEKKIEINPQNEDAVLALMSLGFSRAECLPVVKTAEENGAKTIQEVITYSLKHIR